MINAILVAGAGLWLVIVALVFAAISVYYYFKILQAMYFVPGEPALGEIKNTYPYQLLVLAVLLLILGVFPNLLLNYLYF
jgi:NADH-quinone oxidoreductase subunit N